MANSKWIGTTKFDSAGTATIKVTPPTQQIWRIAQISIATTSTRVTQAVITTNENQFVTHTSGGNKDVASGPVLDLSGNEELKIVWRNGVAGAQAQMVIFYDEVTGA